MSAWPHFYLAWTAPVKCGRLRQKALKFFAAWDALPRGNLGVGVLLRRPLLGERRSSRIARLLHPIICTTADLRSWR